MFFSRNKHQKMLPCGLFSLLLPLLFLLRSTTISTSGDRTCISLHMYRYLLLSSLLVLTWSPSPVTGAPQANLLNFGCSQYNVSDSAVFFANLNASYADLRAQISNSSSSSSFATAQHPRASDPVYVLFQCRPYLSRADCLACLAAAEARIHNCSAANGARVTLDGCFLRCESSLFFDQGTLPGNVGICSGRTTPNAAAAVGLVRNLVVATPRIAGFFAAAERGGVYGAAQCVETVNKRGCSQCLQVALKNIQGCPPDSDGRAVDAGCFLRYSNAAFFPANETVDLAPFLDSGVLNKLEAIIGGVVGGVAGLMLLGLVAFMWVRQSKRPEKAQKGDILGETELQVPLNFHYKDLKIATKNFSEENKLGEGGFGEVYKGVLKNGKIVAVKKLAIARTSRAKADFQSEVKLISIVHHRNLVRLLGCSSEGPDLLLVYEYMANSSLDKFLFGDRHGTLKWKQRFDIIVGMARGLAYLHQEFHVRIIHRDIKSSNILLDEDFQPKIADFGLARLLPSDQSHLSTKFAGTLGYTAPEYAIHGQLSEKVDTYSYGVVVLEIVSGRKSNDIKLEPETQYLLEWAWKLYENGKLIDLVDGTLDPNGYRPEEVKRVIEIALLCTQSTVAARPTMSEVVILLLSNGGPMLQPTSPTFIDATSRVRGDIFSSTGLSSSYNVTASISQLSAR
ncbi:cysteine-rich receptor-like protein kinase 2 [Phoenix dactylifera]|uniref:Cysteine-rich receptor-like protein kinase 2 n=1 Tax=Phoenix dactylifera TaxID=42345 RepID=A0A8B9A1U3_PHODC|nr:cysteine-rich receptor-like protein kinase 2 [Phoenix dactylifera]